MLDRELFLKTMTGLCELVGRELSEIGLELYYQSVNQLMSQPQPILDKSLLVSQ